MGLWFAFAPNEKSFREKYNKLLFQDQGGMLIQVKSGGSLANFLDTVNHQKQHSFALLLAVSEEEEDAMPQAQERKEFGLRSVWQIKACVGSSWLPLISLWGRPSWPKILALSNESKVVLIYRPYSSFAMFRVACLFCNLLVYGHRFMLGVFKTLGWSK